MEKNELKKEIFIKYSAPILIFFIVGTGYILLSFTQGEGPRILFSFGIGFIIISFITFFLSFKKYKKKVREKETNQFECDLRYIENNHLWIKPKLSQNIDFLYKKCLKYPEQKIYREIKKFLDLYIFNLVEIDKLSRQYEIVSNNKINKAFIEKKYKIISQTENYINRVVEILLEIETYNIEYNLNDLSISFTNILENVFDIKDKKYYKKAK